MEEKNRVITISGEPGSGKTTVLEGLKEYYIQKGYRVHVISVGALFRKASVEAYKKEHPDVQEPTIEQINNDESFQEKRNEIDNIVDDLTKEQGEKINSEYSPNDVYIFDSRLAFRNINNAFNIRLTVDPKIAGQRVFNDINRGKEDKYQSLEEAIQKTQQRAEGEEKRYRENGIDLSNENNYDIIIDTSYSKIDDEVEIIDACEQAKREGKSFGKYWISPKQLLPVQNIRDTIRIWKFTRFPRACR